jgi:hypothetical protein
VKSIGCARDPIIAVWCRYLLLLEESRVHRGIL